PADLYTLSLHDALPICHEGLRVKEPAPRSAIRRSAQARYRRSRRLSGRALVGDMELLCRRPEALRQLRDLRRAPRSLSPGEANRSEEHTSELQSLAYLV